MIGKRKSTKIQAVINQNLRLVEESSRHINCIRLHNSTDIKHMMKF